MTARLFLALALLLPLAPACAVGEVLKEGGEVVLEVAPSALGALGAYLLVQTGLSVVIGATLGWLIGDDIEQRIARKAAEVRIIVLEKEVSSKPTTLSDVGVAIAEAIRGSAVPVAIGVVAVVALAAWSRWLKAKKERALLARVQRLEETRA